MNAFPPPVPQKGMSGLAKVGIGCFAVIVVVVIAFVALAAKFMPDIKQFAEESQKTPTLAAAKLMTKMNPDMEVVKADETTKEITIKLKSTGQTMTMSLNDFQQGKGKIKMKDSKGNEITIDPTHGSSASSSDGAPSWIPAYPGAPAPSGTKASKGDTVNGVLATETADDIAKVKAFYEGKLTEAGFKLDTGVTTPEATVIKATKAEEKKSLTLTLNKANNKTTVTLIYSAPQ